MAGHEVFGNFLRLHGGIGGGSGGAVELLRWLHYFLVEYCKHFQKQFLDLKFLKHKGGYLKVDTSKGKGWRLMHDRWGIYKLHTKYYDGRESRKSMRGNIIQNSLSLFY